MGELYQWLLSSVSHFQLCYCVAWVEYITSFKGFFFIHPVVTFILSVFLFWYECKSRDCLCVCVCVCDVFRGGVESIRGTASQSVGLNESFNSIRINDRFFV